MINLNLGAGSNRKKDYLSVDYYSKARPDLVHDLRAPLPYEDETVDNIYASHVIEHFDRAEWEWVRKDWIRVVKPGGTITIRCPDILKSAQKLLDDPTAPMNLYRIYGLQNTPGEFHKNGFTSPTLSKHFKHWTVESIPPGDPTELAMRFTKP